MNCYTNLLHLDCGCRCLWDFLSIKKAPCLFAALHSYFPDTDTKDYTVWKINLRIRWGFLPQKFNGLQAQGISWKHSLDSSCSDDMQTFKQRCISCVCVLPTQLRYMRRIHKHCPELADGSIFLKCLKNTWERERMLNSNKRIKCL